MYYLSGEHFTCLISLNSQSTPMRRMLSFVSPILLTRTHIQKGELTCLRLHCDRASQPGFLLHFLSFLPCCHLRSKEVGLFLKGCNLEEKKSMQVECAYGQNNNSALGDRVCCRRQAELFQVVWSEETSLRKKIFEQRPEEDKVASCMGVCRKNTLESRNSWFKSPQETVSLVC